MNSIFGLELPAPVTFLIAFVVVLALIALVAWAIRRIGASRQEASTRGRQPRLAVVDSTFVDNKRRLMIVRRDNVEHLLMIGGPTDVVVESNIIRATAVARTPSPETLRSAVAPDPLSWTLPADQLSGARETPPAPSFENPPRVRVPPPAAGIRAPTRRPPPPQPVIEPEPAFDDFEPPPPTPSPRAPPAPLAARPAAAPQPAEPDLTEIAQRLESALRRQQAAPPPRTPPMRAAQPARPPAAPQRPPASTPPVPEAEPPAAAPPRRYPAYDPEMANLLGRSPTGKP